MMDYTIRHIGGQVPTQAEGNLTDGRAYYFRARHFRWTLTLSTGPAEADFLTWCNTSEIIATGDDPTGGGMDNAEVIAILDRYL